ncbi:MAG: type IV pilus secretin PilQ [Terriglobia bacterium]
MRRQAMVVLTVTWLMLGIVPTPGGRTWAASDAAILKSVTPAVSPTGAELVLRVDGIYSYKTVQASPETLFIDLAGAKAELPATSQQWVNPVFTGYKLLTYQNLSGKPVVRVQVGTKQAGTFVAQKDDTKLRLVFGKGKNVGSTAAPVPPVSAATGALTHLLPQALSSGPLLVSNVTLDTHDSGETLVEVSTSRSASYRVKTLPSPARLVIDIDGATVTSPAKSYPAYTAVLKAIRVGQFRAPDPSIVRVVADLNGDPAYNVRATPAGITIDLRPREAAKPKAPTQQASVPPVTATEPKTVQTVVIVPPPTSAPKVEAFATTTEVIDRKPAETAPVPVQTRDSLRADVQSTLPPIAVPKQLVAAPLPNPASVTPEALRAEQAAQTLTPGKDDSAMSAQAPPPTTLPPAGAEQSKPEYTGEPISLNLKDVDLKDFFRLIHEISGLNIIIDPNVSGSVTMVLDSVPWDQALDIVLKNNDLGKVLEGNVLRIAKMQTLTAEQEGQTKLASARMDAAPLVTVFRPINYAKAMEIATLLKTWAGGGALSRRGTVLVDMRANTLIISDVQSQIPIIQNILTKLDKKAKQVSIEARVVLANADFTHTLSAALYGTGIPGASTQAGAVTSSSAGIIPGTTTPVTPAAVTGFGTFAITNASSRYLINAIITAQEERDQAKTISRPTIVTQNNIQGMVQQGVQVPIQTTVNNTVSVQYYAATLQLTVTPQVTDDNNIFLIIHVLNDSVGASISGVGPEINTQEATTQVLVPDGGTVVFGGITVTSRSKSATYVPWLGNIPVLGHLFKTSNVQGQDQELLFFVSPKILPT